jgi:hypothetical protein
MPRFPMLVYRWLKTSSVFKFIAAVEPSSDLLHFLRHFNPDFWFECRERESDVNSVLAWLKVCVVVQFVGIVEVQS